MVDADLLIINAAQLVTCASPDGPKRRESMADVGIIPDGAVAIVDGKCAGVGSTKDIRRDFASENVIDADGRVVCPGFVDPHTHIVYAGDRLNEFELKIKGAEYLEILASGGGIISTVTSTREASVEGLAYLARQRLDKMLTCGTTTCEIKTGYGLDLKTELRMLDVIARLDETHLVDISPTLLAAHTIPPEYSDNPNAYVDLICDETLRRAWDWYESSSFAPKGTPFFCDVFTEKNAFDLSQSKRVLTTAKALGYGIKAHVDQFSNLGGTRMALELGAVSVDHLDAISDDEITLLAGSDTLGIVIPTENFSAGKTTFAPARKMIDAGCAIALSTNYNPGSAPCPSMPMAMAIACRNQKLLPTEALNAATINAAHALGRGERFGSIEVGKQADMLILDCADYRQVAYEFGGNLINQVIKSGKMVRDGRHQS